jgi:hypothetical protein
MLRTPLAAALVVDAGNWTKMPQDNSQGNPKTIGISVQGVTTQDSRSRKKARKCENLK